MEEGKENIKYSTEDIRKYLEGQLTDREMQALEKAALEDPFLADALEGLEESRRQSVSFETNISDLQKRLADRIHLRDRKKGIVYLLSNWQVAASVLFVIGTAVLTFTFINNKGSRTNIAKTIKKDSGIENLNPRVQDILLDSTAVAQKNSPPSVSAADSTVTAFAEPVAIEKKSRVKKAQEQESAESQDKFSNSRAVNTLSDSLIVKKDITGAATQHALPASPPKPAEAQLSGRVSGVLITSTKEISGNYFQGVVVDDSNAPVSSATVILPGSKKEVSTNDSGYFRMYLDKTKTAGEIVINRVGYQPVTASFNPDSSLVQKFRMKASPQTLNDVVVMGYSSKKREETEETYSKEKTGKPVDPLGWDSLVRYINSNKKIMTADSLLKGEEVISFSVNKNGELSSFKVVKSISPVHDAEIIRLIKSGPPLKPQKGKNQICEIVILFK